MLPSTKRRKTTSYYGEVMRKDRCTKDDMSVEDQAKDKEDGLKTSLNEAGLIINETVRITEDGHRRHDVLLGMTHLTTTTTTMTLRLSFARN